MAAPSRLAAIASTPGAGADVEHAPAPQVDLLQRARHRRVVAWWPVPKPIDGWMTTIVGCWCPRHVRRARAIRPAPEPATSHGGATMTSPTGWRAGAAAIARPSPRRGRRPARTTVSGKRAQRRVRRGRGRRACEEDAPGVRLDALVDGGDVVVDEGGLQAAPASLHERPTSSAGQVLHGLSRRCP